MLTTTESTFALLLNEATSLVRASAVLLMVERACETPETSRWTGVANAHRARVRAVMTTAKNFMFASWDAGR